MPFASRLLALQLLWHETSLTDIALPPTISAVGNAVTPEPSNRTSTNSRIHLFWLTLILIFASTLRLHGLVTHAYVLDEDWSLEIATGRGSLHLKQPTDQIITPAPAFYSLADAPPWWHIWTHMEVTHPPLYPVLLRWWEDVVGDSDYNGRLFSVIASLAAIAVFFDTVRLQSGLRSAVWAGLLLSIASPQVEHARLARSYGLLLAICLVTTNLVTRIQLFGSTRRRWICLAIAILATLMTHYFCVGALIGLMLYSIWFLPARRSRIFAAFAIPGLAFLVIWGPWMWQQRHLFATDDPSTIFLTSNGSHHRLTTCLRVLLNPLRMLFPISGEGIPGLLAMLGGAMLWIAPFLPVLYRKNRFVLMWGLWIAGTVGIIGSLDLSRGTDHLEFVRYTILVGPAVYALIASLFNRWRFATLAVVALAVAGCLINLPDVYNHDDLDPRQLAANLIAVPGSRDCLVIAAPAKSIPLCDIYLLMLSRYLHPMPGSVAIFTHAANSETQRALEDCRFIFLDTQEPDYHTYFPHARLLGAQSYHGLGHLFTLQLDRTERSSQKK